MKKSLAKIALSASFGLALALTSCSGDDGGGKSHKTVKKEKISGVSQKGPFAQEATVKVYELDENMNKGKSFVGKTDDKGNFEIEINSELSSPYVILEVSGSYVSEVSGQSSNGSITLNAIADVSNRDNVNINVLTHLEYDKALKLAKSGTDFEDAKKAAQEEVLNALGISGSGVKNSEDMTLFGGNAGDSVLLVTSVILQADRTTEEVSSLLSEFSSEIKNSGTLSEATKSEVTNGVESLNIDDLKGNIWKLDPAAKVPSLDDIQKIVEKIDSSGDYKSVKIGEQVWMAENLNNVRLSDEISSKCYNNSLSNCTLYGKLYDWATAMALPSSCNKTSCASQITEKHKGICPSGWHIPSDAEWDALMKAVNTACPLTGDCDAANELRNTSGFAALLGGYGTLLGSLNFDGLGEQGFWWSSTENNTNATNAYGRRMKSNDEIVARSLDSKSSLFSVRCVKD
jgi:uncharacterized protein (TIGR02145 family)